MASEHARPSLQPGTCLDIRPLAQLPEGINLTQDTPPAFDNFMAHQVHLTKLGIKLGFYQLSILVMFKSLGRACLTLCAEQTVG